MRVVARYLVAAFAFVAAAIWVGVSLTGGVECLFVFVLAFQAVLLYHRRSDSRSRPATSRRERASRYEPALSDEASISASAPPQRSRSRSAMRVYDADREGFGVPVASQATW
jgi:hypothetical protein